MGFLRGSRGRHRSGGTRLMTRLFAQVGGVFCDNSCSWLARMYVGLTCQHPNRGWLADGPEIMIRRVRERRV